MKKSEDTRVHVSQHLVQHTCSPSHDQAISVLMNDEVHCHVSLSPPSTCKYPRLSQLFQNYFTLKNYFSAWAGYLLFTASSYGAEFFVPVVCMQKIFEYKIILEYNVLFFFRFDT